MSSDPIISVVISPPGVGKQAEGSDTSVADSHAQRWEEARKWETRALDQHQQRWSLALLPCAAIAILVAGAIYLYSTIDKGSAGNLSIEAPRIVSPGQTPAPAVPLPVSASAAPPGQNAKKPEANNQDSKPNASKPQAEPQKAGAEPQKAGAEPPAPTAAAPIMEADPAYPLLQPHNIQDSLALSYLLLPNNVAPKEFRSPRASRVAAYLWKNFSVPTQWDLLHAYDPIQPRNVTFSHEPDRLGDVTSPARLKTALADALNAQMDDEMFAVRFQPQKWLVEARKAMEREGDPRFRPEQIHNASRLARKLLELPKPTFKADLRKALSTAANANPSSSQQKQPDGRQAAASALNQLLQGPPLFAVANDTFSASDGREWLTELQSAALPQQNSGRSPAALTGARSDKALLVNRLLLEQTYANYLDKATPRPSPTTLQRLNRLTLTQTYAAQISDDPRPAPSNAAIAERQAGRLAWLTFVGLNMAIYLGVIFAALSIILAAVQYHWERSTVTKLRREDINEAEYQKWKATQDASAVNGLLEALQKSSQGQPDKRALYQKLFRRRNKEGQAGLDTPEQAAEIPSVNAPQEGAFSLTDDIIAGLNNLLSNHDLYELFEEEEKKREDAKKQSLLKAQAKGNETQKQDWRRRFNAWLQQRRLETPMFQPSLEQWTRIYGNYHKLLYFEPPWTNFPKSRIEDIEVQYHKLKYARDAEQRNPLSKWQSILRGLLFVLGIMGLTVTLTFPVDEGTLGGLLAITAQRDLPEILTRLGWFEKLGLAAAILLTLATSMLLIPPSQEDKADIVSHAAYNSAPDKQQNLDDEVALFYARKMQHLRNILYISTAVLASSVLQVSYTYNWALTYLTAPHASDLYKQVEQLTKTIVMERGIYYTLMLAAIYFPAYAVLRARAAELAEEAWRHQNERNSVKPAAEAVKPPAALPPSNSQSSRQANRIARWVTQALAGVLGRQPSDKANAADKPADKPADAPTLPANTLQNRDEWLKARGLGSTVWEMLPRLAAVALPLLTGPAAELVKTMIGGK